MTLPIGEKWSICLRCAQPSWVALGFPGVAIRLIQLVISRAHARNCRAEKRVVLVLTKDSSEMMDSMQLFRKRRLAMKQMVAVLVAWGTLLVGLGCSQGSSEAETKKAEEQMQKQMEQISQELPAKID